MTTCIESSTLDEFHSLLFYQKLHIPSAHGQLYPTLFVCTLGRVMLVAVLVDFAMVVSGPTILQVVKGLVDPLLMVIEVDTFGGRGTDYDIEVVL